MGKKPLHAMVLWHTLAMQAARTPFHHEGIDVASAEVARLSPMVHRHINVQGWYAFALAESVTQGAWRRLRAPHELEE